VEWVKFSAPPDTIGEKGKEWGGGENGREEEGHEPPSIKTKFTCEYGGVEVRERRGQGRE